MENQSSVKFGTPNARRRRVQDQSGQGTVEYVLILMITVIIILSIMWQFHTAFRNYANQFFDGYIACLLETGELPGGANCQPEMQAFNINTGTKLAEDGSYDPGPDGGTGDSGPGPNPGPDGGSGNSGDSGRGGGAGASASTGSQGENGENGAGGGSGSGNSSSGEAIGGGGDDGPVAVGKFITNRKGTTNAGTFKGTKEEAALAGVEPLTGSAEAGEIGSSSRNESKRTALEGGFGYAEEEEQREQERPPISEVAKKSEGPDQLKPKIAVEEPFRETASIKDDDGEGFSFGYMMRMLLIIAIILAIVVFFGGQILQASKSWEKGGGD